MTKALDAAIRAACNAECGNCAWPSNGCIENACYYPDTVPAALRAALPAEPTREMDGEMRVAYREALFLGMNPIAAAYRALRAHLLGEDERDVDTDHVLDRSAGPLDPEDMGGEDA